MATPSRLLLLPRRQALRHLSSVAGPEKKWCLRTILHLLSSQQLTCEELARYCHEKAQAGEEILELRAFSRLTPFQSIQEAAQSSDERRRLGQPKSRLDGIPFSVKANLAVQDQPLTAGSRILGEGPVRSHPVGYNAELVQHLISCGAICVGITNMDEFGMGSLGTNARVSTKNPLPFSSNSSHMSILELLKQSPSKISASHQDNDNHHYSAGGSSCGAATSVAHGSSLIALGSDTGGSIRLPAAWCGIVGLKPSYGRVSRHGLVSYASSLDTVGYLTPTVDCAVLAWEELGKVQQDAPQDSTSHYYSMGHKTVDEAKTNNSTSSVVLPLRGIKIGIPSAFVVKECPDNVKEAWSQGAVKLQEAGATVVSLDSGVVSPEIIQQSLAAYYVLASAEASSNLARYDGFRYGVAAEKEHQSSDDGMTSLQRQYAATRTQGFGREVIRRILCGTAVLSSDKFHTHYESAAKVRALVTKQLHDALTTHVDYLLIPTVVSPPPRLSKEKETSEGVEDDDSSLIDNTAMFANDIMTVPISLAGLAAVTVPFNPPSASTMTSRFVAEDVIGLQLVGHRLEEEALLDVARFLEK